MTSTSPDLEPEVKAFCEQVARISVRVLKDPSTKTRQKTTKFEKPKDISLLPLEEAAKIPEVAESQVFRALCDRQKEHPNNKMLVVVGLT